MISEELKKKYIEKSGELGKQRAELQILEFEVSDLYDQIRQESATSEGFNIKSSGELKAEDTTIESKKDSPSPPKSSTKETVSESYEEAAKEEEAKEEEEKVTLIDIQNPPEDLPSSSKSITIDDAIEWMDQMPEADRKEWAKGDTRLGILRYLGYSEAEIEEIRNEDDQPDESEDEDNQEESSESENKGTQDSEVPTPPPPPAPPKPPSKPEAPKAEESKEEEETETEPEAPKEETKKEESPKNEGSMRVDLPDGVVRPEGSPECFGNSEVYDPENRVCLTCIYDYECQEAIAAQEDA